MRSRTSSCNRTIFKKDITRFAPVWVLYTVFLILCLAMQWDTGREDLAKNIVDFIRIMPLVQFIYAPVCAQMLFGDLYNTRMCNALHALPIRRGSWFRTHVAAGILFALVPELVVGGLMALLLGPYALVAVGWMAASMLMFLCFFAVAVFGVFCGGNRFSMVLVYAIVNFFAVMVYWLWSSLYEPLLFGISTDFEWFMWFCPVYTMLGSGDYMLADYKYGSGDVRYLTLSWGENWWYLLVCAGLGLALLAVAWWMYRRRRLEVAGDFLAVKKLEPVFLLLYTLCAGAACQIFCYMFTYEDNGYLYLLIGLAVGFFTGKMLLKRTVRIFRGKTFLQFAVLVGVIGGSLLMTKLDVFHITTWVPQVEQVQSVTVWSGSAYSYNPHFTVEEPEGIRDILSVHEAAIGESQGIIEPVSDTLRGTATEETLVYNGTAEITLCYTLTNGRAVTRNYSIHTATDEGTVLGQYFSSPECVLGFGPEEIDAFLAQFQEANADDMDYTGESMRELVEAILLDCENGSMNQVWDYHWNESTMLRIKFLYWPGTVDYLGNYVEMEDTVWFKLYLFESCENTIAWLENHGVRWE